MMLLVRMVLYALSAGLAGYGIGTYDATSGVYSVSLDQLSEIVAGALGFLGTFAASRIAKARGGAT